LPKKSLPIGKEKSMELLVEPLPCNRTHLGQSFEASSSPPETETVNVSSNNNSADVTFDMFEGPEKLLEVWFGPFEQRSDVSGAGQKGLRNVSREKWDEMLGLVKCGVLNVQSNDYFDAYLLSESSMFIWNGRIILKTCGTTTLLNAVPLLLEIAASVGLTQVENLFYSRKKFMFPEKQLVPHSSFSHEVDFLDQIFENGSAYVLGKLNDEHWYLYMTDPASPLSKDRQALPDKTLEILMGNLDPVAMRPFFKKAGLNAKEATKLSGIADLFPDATFDDFLFSPCGYSVNAIMGKHYFTIHVTPQEPCSFASFETNVVLADYNNLVKQVVNVFRPGQLSSTLFSNEPIDSLTTSTAQFDLEGYKKAEKIFYQFKSYNLLFVSQKKK